MKDMLLLANRAAGCSALLLGLVCFGCSDDETEPDGFGGGITAASITTVAPPTSGADTGSSSSSTTTGEAASGDGESTTTGASIEDASSTETPTTGSVDDCPDGTCEPTSTGPAGATTGGGEVTTGGSTGMEQVCEIDVPDPACTGMADGFVYVATVEHGGSEFHDGMSPDKPVSSLMKAIEQALMCPGGCDIVVSHGVYKGSIVLASGVDIYGGYAPETFKYDPGQNPVEVIGTDTRTVIADGLDQPTRLVELTIRGKDFNSEGHSSYGLWARGGVAWSLTVERCEILGGHGGDGLDSGSGTPGESGEPGFDTPTQLWSHGASGGGSACSAAGGAGGFASKCSNGIPSKKGQTPSGGGSGGPGGPQGGDHCTWGIHDDSGGKGGLGQPGGPGSSGAGGAQPESPDGTFSNGLWKGTAGKNGGKGKAGGGGGGGGAGGSDEDFDVEPGAGGAGGGSGGCGGGGGIGGKAGGGSFGAVLVDTSVRFVDSELLAGQGGEGGKGGSGSDGGEGGEGGIGAKAKNVNNGEGGAGGNGGPGGEGGGGGGGSGGCGGVSIGVVRVGLADYELTGTFAFAGLPGSGGAGGQGGHVGGNGTQAQNGGLGCTGKAEDAADY